MKKKSSHSRKRVQVPILWRLCAWILMIPLGIALFILILKKNGVSFPIQAGQSTDPFFFAGIFSLVIPLLLIVYVEKVLRGIAAKRSASEIAKDVATDIATTGAAVALGTALDALTGSDGKSSGDGDADSEKMSGGGGEFGGGGASGNY